MMKDTFTCTFKHVLFSILKSEHISKKKIGTQ